MQMVLTYNAHLVASIIVTMRFKEAYVRGIYMYLMYAYLEVSRMKCIVKAEQSMYYTSQDHCKCLIF
jgi:hypothetical protein